MGKKKRSLRILLTGGGSSGHVNPLIAIAEALRNSESDDYRCQSAVSDSKSPDYAVNHGGLTAEDTVNHGGLTADVQFLYVGVRRGLEALVVPRHDLPLRFACSRGMPSSKFSFSMLRFLLVLKIGIIRALIHLIVFRPNIIVASGGYASAPSVFAAAILRIITLRIWSIPVYIHEQNAVPGRMNLFAARFASMIGVCHEDALKRFDGRNVELVGYPVRSSFRIEERNNARKQLGLSDEDEYVVVFGGSQGARTINRAFVQALPQLSNRPNLHIIHASGTMDAKEYNAYDDTEGLLSEYRSQPTADDSGIEFRVQPSGCSSADNRGGLTAGEGDPGFGETGLRYNLVKYLHDMPLHLAAADLAVIRAGAGSLVEICAAGVPAVVIPKANLPGDSQVANARSLAKQGAVEIIYEEPFFTKNGMQHIVSVEKLAFKIISLLDNPSRRAEMSSNAHNAFDINASDHIAKQVIELTRKKTSVRTVSSTGISARESEQSITTSQHPNIPTLHLPDNPTNLRRKIESLLGVRWEDAFHQGRIVDDQLKRLPELSYLRYRGAALLAHSNWMTRNEGVKLLGLTRYEERLDLLSKLITDRTPASRLHRLLGGDYLQPGFVRRNALSALAFISVWNIDVREAVIAALNDPYFEVRSAALKLLRLFDDEELEDITEIVNGVMECTRQKNLEVKREALNTFGLIGEPEEVLETCRPYLLNSHVLIREGVLKAWFNLLERFIGQDIGWKEALCKDMDRFLITSVSVQPFFPLKQEFTRLVQRLGKETTRDLPFS
ncbi:MAG: glycosyltransferase [Candidatus Hatepunaea meridiana]|nr:glycosyltransferase [Candidatus Hatepunaea meridiana]